MIKAKKKYTTKIQTNLSKDPAKAWTDVKKLSGLTTDQPVITPTPIYSPDELKNFFLWFEKSSLTKPNPEHQNHTHLSQCSRQMMYVSCYPDSTRARVSTLITSYHVS